MLGLSLNAFHTSLEREEAHVQPVTILLIINNDIILIGMADGSTYVGCCIDDDDKLK